MDNCTKPLLVWLVFIKLGWFWVVLAGCRWFWLVVGGFGKFGLVLAGCVFYNECLFTYDVVPDTM